MKTLTQWWWFKRLDVRINVYSISYTCYTWFMHALHMVSIHMGKSQNVSSPPPDWMADCKARARRWCGCTSAGVDPPRPGIRTNGKDMIKANQFGWRKCKSARYITLAHVQKHALNYCHKNPLPHSNRPSSPPPISARRAGTGWDILASTGIQP